MRSDPASQQPLAVAVHEVAPGLVVCWARGPALSLARLLWRPTTPPSALEALAAAGEIAWLNTIKVVRISANNVPELSFVMR